MKIQDEIAQELTLGTDYLMHICQTRKRLLRLKKTEKRRRGAEKRK
jgi:hypothetical protein